MQANTYLKYGDIKGEATAEAYKEMITLLSVDWSVGREITSFTGTAQDREASAARLYDMTITKLQDSASTALFKEATIGMGVQAVFHMTKQGKDGVEDIMNITLTDAMISSYAVSVQDDRPIETITISYTQMEMNVMPSDDTNKKGDTLRYAYSGTKGQSM
ncbi:Hcp family type VI secretion system effector [Photobacterium sanguinicancri]|uniref:Hcp family type VI secretion system effector n=1 Tax=Photobacterium sanguinicancri TaxID=875932 RepID=UPI0021C43B90|nr:type VI secretion system tube protein Hcp [Photobacterium sanguinicancri]MDO6498421.1 type VI secretion system tube protein Hcp [Photobacterium sanguinicancri]